MTSWLHQLKEIQQQGLPAISVAVASTKGSVPREAGTRMLVTIAEVLGTIGGGHLEFKAIEIARDILATGGHSSLQRFPLGASLGQCCGGLVNLLFEPVASDAEWVDQILALQQQEKSCVAVTAVHGNAGKLLVTADGQTGSLGSDSLDQDAATVARQRLASDGTSTLLTLAGDEYFFERIPVPDFNVVLFGAGHVGRALVKILADLPCRITWVDSREEEFPSQIPGHVIKRVNEFPVEEVAAAPTGSYFLVMTHSHQLDQVICEHIFKRNDFAYFGLIGSLSKRRQFERRLMARGVAAERLAEMTCPIGANGVSSKEPMAIAVSVVLELLRRREALQERRPDSLDSTPIPPCRTRIPLHRNAVQQAPDAPGETLAEPFPLSGGRS